MSSGKELSEISEEETTEVNDNNENKNESAQIYQTKLIELMEKINEGVKAQKELLNLTKNLEKDFNKIAKTMNKLQKQKARKSSRPLSGFAIPSKLSDELYEFLKIQPETLIARKDVTKMINEYIKENDCRDQKDRRKIIPNEKLKVLFNCEDNAEITYFNLQSYMKHHYVK